MTNSSNYNIVKDRIEEFKQFLQEFKEAHAAYHSLTKTKLKSQMNIMTPQFS